MISVVLEIVDIFKLHDLNKLRSFDLEFFIYHWPHFEINQPQVNI